MNSLFTRELEHLINKYSMENESNTPDFILAKYLERCMTNYALTISQKDNGKTRQGNYFRNALKELNLFNKRYTIIKDQTL